MGHSCCGGKGHKNINTDKYYGNVERTKLRMSKIEKILELAGNDAIFFREELAMMNRAGSEVIANNHALRAEIYDLKAKNEMLVAKLDRMANATTIEELEKAKHFPFDEAFRKIED
jgi:hypothetical protein